jgi:hypothetical protein
MAKDNTSDSEAEEWDDNDHDDDDDDDDDDDGHDENYIESRHTTGGAENTTAARQGESFQSIIEVLQSPITNQQQQQTKSNASQMKDPKTIRLAAVTCAIVDIVRATNNTTSDNDDTTTTVTAAQVYAQAITALEGTLKVTLPTTHSTSTDSRTNIIDIMMDTFATTNAIFELLCITIPHISASTSSSSSSSSTKGSNIVAHTLQSFTTRIFRAVIQSTISFATTQLGTGNINMNSSTSNSNGGTTAVLRNLCRTSAILLQHMPEMTSDVAVQQFLQGTLLQLFDSDTPKVRKAAQAGLMEVLAQISSEEQKRIHPSIIKTLNVYVNKELQSMITQYENKQTLQRCLHLLPFLERTIYFLNYQEISHSIMILLTTLQQSVISHTSTTNDFVTVKVKETTPKVLVVASILNLVLCMLQPQEESSTDDFIMSSETILTFSCQFAQRVIATLLQIKAQFLHIMNTTSVEYEICEKTKLLYGQVMIASLQQQQSLICRSDDVVGNKSIETFCTLFPLSIQAIVQLCKPTMTNIPQHKNYDTSTNMISQTLFIELTQLIRSHVPMLIGMIEPSNDVDTYGKKSSPLCIMITKCFHDILECMNKAILCDTSYRSTWSVALPMISILLQNIHTVLSNEEISSIVESLIVLHNDSTTAAGNKKDIENALSTLLQGVGIETFWSYIAWKNPSSSELSASTKSKSNENTIIELDRAWVLSVMKSAASNRSNIPPHLEFFQKNVLELARQCDTISKQSKASKASIRNAARARVIDLWNLFPCFCLAVPSDIVQVLPSLHVTLGRVLEDKRYPELLVSAA